VRYLFARGFVAPHLHKIKKPLWRFLILWSEQGDCSPCEGATKGGGIIFQQKNCRARVVKISSDGEKLFLTVGSANNKSALQEQAHTEQNQQHLLSVQPPPKITWSLERDNLIKRFKLQNDRSVMFYMYVFINVENEKQLKTMMQKINSTQ
jgi:hypothetical protein